MELVLTITKTKDVVAGDISRILAALEKAGFNVKAVPTYFEPIAIKITRVERS